MIKVTNREYRQHPAISRSDLFKISKSPMHFKYEQENPPEPTTELRIGIAFHKLVLEPEDFDSDIAVVPKIDRRTKEGKAAWEKFKSSSSDKTIISNEEFERIQAMSEAVKANPYVMRLLDGDKEISFFWKDDLTGEECKCRPDCLTIINNHSVIVDLKSTENASSESFMRDVVKYGYDMQAAMYKEGVETANKIKDCMFVFIAIEKKPPYAINILQADELVLRRGYDLFREFIGIYHNCKETGNWYGYNGFSGYINNLSLPKWLAKDYE